MTDICNNIDTTIQSKLSNVSGIKFFGFCQLVIKSNQPIPSTIPDNKQVAIDDRFEGIAYYRLIGTTPVNQPIDFQWGSNLNNVYKSKLRNIVALKVKKFAEDFIYDYSSSVPNWLDISGYKLVDIQNNGVINNDQLAIKNQEFGTNWDERHSIPWNIYALEYDVDFIKC